MKITPYTLDPSKPAALLASCPIYQPSPLSKVEIGGQHVWIKDESDRMSLGAFKALGGVYAVASLIARQSETDLSTTDDPLAALRVAASGMTFVCASAGNHGLAVAAGARLFHARARIHLADTVPESFADRLRAKDAEVVRSGADYEASIEAAIKDADDTGAIHLADGSWPGYTEPPRLVMEGYTVLAEEMRAAFEQSVEWPTHVFLQAGVGGLAAAVAFMIRRNWAVQPTIIVVEPDAAACLRDSHRAETIVSVDGPVSNMGRLDCKRPSMIAFDILEAAGVDYIAVSDAQASDAADRLGEHGLMTTPSGAAGFAGFAAAALGADAHPLIIMSEGQV